ncbi:MAG: siderophore-interacting protein [Actinomycetota bacterium]
MVRWPFARTMYGEVVATERLSPSMVRIVLGGGMVGRFRPTGFTDEYVNALFLPEAADYQPPFDPKAARKLDPAVRPRPRRFSVRRWEPDQQRLTIDFTVHGDAGYAGSWANRATPGDRLQFHQPGGRYAPSPEAPAHLFAGDESALPAIARSLEALPAQAVGWALVVVDDADHHLDLDRPAGIELAWLHRRGATDPAALLPEAVAGIDVASTRPELFVHGEFGEVRAVRDHLAEQGLTVSGASISPYWRRGLTDEERRAAR